MAIHYNERFKTFYLNGKDFSYVFRIGDGGYLHHLYFGEQISERDIGYLSSGLRAEFSPAFDAETSFDSLDLVPQEYPLYGRGDYREPAVMVTGFDGGKVVDFKYSSHIILNEKPEINNMPSLRGGETLVVVLSEKAYELRLFLYYTVYEDCGAIARRAVLENVGKKDVVIDKINSFGVDFLRSDFDKICLQGGWAKENGVERSELTHGIYEISSTRGSSSHQLNPFLALCDKNADEYTGTAYGFNLVYSGSFSIKAQVDQTGTTRVGGGVNEKGFAWKLRPETSFETPEAVLVYSGEGFGKMSRNFHDLYRSFIINPDYVFKKRPIALNCWESFYFNFDEKAIFSLIEKAKGTGIDTFVLDDGWFGERNSEKSGLGDWRVNLKKLSGGLKPIIDKCRENGMKFGIWIEPEMVSEDSDLFRAHPDWAIRHPKIEPCKGRYQYVLDFSDRKVVEHIKDAVTALLAENDISYVKWDMNRNLTEFYSLNPDFRGGGELAHRYILGVYSLAEYLTEKFPDVFFEGCSGGGGRFDPAMLRYFPQIWASDNTDALARAAIQYGTSFCYPLSSISGHVSVCPNHQTDRVTPFKSRRDIASFCATGFELDLNSLSEEDFNAVSEHVGFYNAVSDLILKGDLYRLKSPFESNYFAQTVVSKDKKRAVFVLMKKAALANDVYPVIKFKGLKEDYDYEIRGDVFDGKLYGGDILCKVGLRFPNELKDFETVSFTLHAKETR